MESEMRKWGSAHNAMPILPEYPRPQIKRDSYLNLNGEWDFAITKSEDLETYDEKIIVPFAPETPASGIERQVNPDDFLHYRTYFKIPKELLNDRFILHFGAVDQACNVRLNGVLVGYHEGGYVPFNFDVTPHIRRYSDNVLEVTAVDKTEYSPMARGRQKLDTTPRKRQVFHTPTSGIWQTVWLESVDSHYIRDVKVTPDFDTGSVKFFIETNRSYINTAQVTISYQGKTVKKLPVTTNKEKTISLQSIHPWTPENPNLYEVSITFSDDEVMTYFAMRKLTVERDRRDILRFYLNNEPYFVNGVIDQGYWPETLMTAPSDEAVRYDIEAVKDRGFNAVRKHAKIEAARFYYHCDRLGLLVWQDIPSGGLDYNRNFVQRLPRLLPIVRNRINDQRHGAFNREDVAGRRQYYKELETFIEYLSPFPSVVTWILFHEGWGQFDANKATKYIEKLDDDRLISETSGWFDQGSGDIYSIHSYRSKLRVSSEPERAVALTSYGYFVSKSPEEPKESLALRKKYKKKFEEDILANIHHGLSAAFYHQWADVEEEDNGLMTFDRGYEKVNSKDIKQLNDKLYTLFDELTR